MVMTVFNDGVLQRFNSFAQAGLNVGLWVAA
jgi:hypothetical protein